MHGVYFGWIPLDKTRLNPGDYFKKFLKMDHQFELAGFPMVCQGLCLMNHRQCAFANVDPYEINMPVYRHFCSTNHGNSGSPIWYCDQPNQNCHVVAIHSSSQPVDLSGVNNLTDVFLEEKSVGLSNYATPLSAFRDGVQRALATEPPPKTEPFIANNDPNPPITDCDRADRLRRSRRFGHGCP